MPVSSLSKVQAESCFQDKVSELRFQQNFLENMKSSGDSPQRSSSRPRDAFGTPPTPLDRAVWGSLELQPLSGSHCCSDTAPKSPLRALQLVGPRALPLAVAQGREIIQQNMALGCGTAKQPARGAPAAWSWAPGRGWQPQTPAGDAPPAPLTPARQQRCSSDAAKELAPLSGGHPSDAF